MHIINKLLLVILLTSLASCSKEDSYSKKIVVKAVDIGEKNPDSYNIVLLDYISGDYILGSNTIRTELNSLIHISGKFTVKFDKDMVEEENRKLFYCTITSISSIDDFRYFNIYKNENDDYIGDVIFDEEFQSINTGFKIMISNYAIGIIDSDEITITVR